MQFVPYPKTPRLKRDVVITEKIDGTNAQIVIVPESTETSWLPEVVAVGDGVVMLVGSRTRWITPGKSTDNFGFARWCKDNATELFKLGIGTHFGEWYGQGIQRGYGLDHRRFALFNTARWGSGALKNTPACCEVVPVLNLGGMERVDDVLNDLVLEGSCAVPGWPTPEGICVYHSASKQTFKVLIENDELPKALADLGYTKADLDASSPYTQGIPAL